MRVVSLLPAATEWIWAFGAGSLLVGRSHGCTDPPDVLSLPPVTGPARGSNPGVREGSPSDGAAPGAVWTVDHEALRALRPDVIVTGGADLGGGVPASHLAGPGQGGGDPPPRIVWMEGATLKQVLAAALDLGRVLGHLEGAMRYIAAAEGRLRGLRDGLGLRRRSDPRGLPALACLVTLDPSATGGLWVPDLIELAGGRPVRAFSWGELEATDPDVLVIAAPGRWSLRGDEAEERRARKNTVRLQGLKAVREGRAYVVDGRRYVNRPGPGLYRSVELLAAALHSDRLPNGLAPGEEEMRPLSFRRGRGGA